MNAILEKRAATILFNFLTSNFDKRPFLLPSNICPIVPLTFLKACRSFEFVDVSPDTFCMNEDLVLARLQESTDCAGVLFVRTYGIASSFEGFFAKIKAISDKLLIIDDRCLCTPVLGDIDTKADLVLFSTGYAKIVDIGFGGLGILKSGLIYNRNKLSFSPRALEDIERVYKQAVAEKVSYHYEDSAWLDTSPVGISLEQYLDAVRERIEPSLEHKRVLNALYVRDLPHDVQLDKDYQWWRFNILVPERDALVKRIFANGLFASTHYASLGGIMGEGKFPVAEKVQIGIINLFNDQYMDMPSALRLVQIINDHISSQQRND